MRGGMSEGGGGRDREREREMGGEQHTTVEGKVPRQPQESQSGTSPGLTDGLTGLRPAGTLLMAARTHQHAHTEPHTNIYVGILMNTTLKSTQKNPYCSESLLCFSAEELCQTEKERAV